MQPSPPEITVWQRTFLAHPILEALISERLCASQVWYVGGVVRDILSGFVSFSEIDLTTTIELSVIERCLSSLPAVIELKSYRKFGTLSVFCKGGEEGVGSIARVDFVRARKESYAAPGSLPLVVPGTLTEDLQRRDFSVNAIALSIGESDSSTWRSALIDPMHGVPDLKRKELRVLHEKSFHDDPTRMFRGIRYATRMNLSFERVTEQLIAEAVSTRLLMSISIERIMHEVDLICSEISALTMLAEIDRLKYFSCFSQAEAISYLLALPDIKDFTGKEVFWAFKVFWCFLTPVEHRMTMAPKLQLSKKFTAKIDACDSTEAVNQLLSSVLTEKRMAKNSEAR